MAITEQEAVQHMTCGNATTSEEIVNEYAVYAVGLDGKNLNFIDKRTGTDYLAKEDASPFARIMKAGQVFHSSSLSSMEGALSVGFGASGVHVSMKVTTHKHYFALEVISISDEQVEELVFADIPLTLRGLPNESFAGCALAMNLRTNVPEIPGPNNRLRAICYPRFGFAGAKVAVIGCPQSQLRAVMQEVVSGAEDLPHSSIGGPWALDAPINRGSYLFNFGDVTEGTVGDWIGLLQRLGFNQLDFHGGRSFRFGDCRPDPQMYPRGLDSLKAVIDQLHAAGIVAGLHTYAFFIDKTCPWVTPVPDPRLGKDATSHAQGAKVNHLKECFGLFTPDGDSSLFSDVAARTADVFNTCGFDMIYLDALDGEDILGGMENGWHYGSNFVFELWKRLKRPALMEMSTFYHHLWFVRSRMGAWDHPMRTLKKFIDMHAEANDACDRMFPLAHLGWWAAKTWSGIQEEPTFQDDIEYLCCKCIGNDSGFSLMGIDPSSIHKIPALPRLAEIIRRYESLRQANDFPQAIKARLKEPGKEFTLIRSQSGAHQFQPVHYAKHKGEGSDGWSNVWKTCNPFGRQPAGVRIEALMAVGPYDATGNVTLADFSHTDEFTDSAAAEGVCADLRPSSDQVKVASISGCYTASGSLRWRVSVGMIVICCAMG